MQNKTKKTDISPDVEHQIEIVEEHYDVDRESRIIFLKLHYEKASELLETHIKSSKKPIFKADILSDIKDIMDTFPEGFITNLELDIDDYEGYDPNVLMKSFNDHFEFSNIVAKRASKSDWFKAILLTLGGLLFMLFNLFAKQNNWYESGLTSEAFDFILSTLSTLFIWEAGTVLFLRSSDPRLIGIKFLLRINRLSLCDSNGNVLVTEDKHDIDYGWIKFNQIDKTGRFLIVFSSFVIGVDCFSGISTVFSYLTSSSSYTGSALVTMIVSIVGVVFQIIVCIAGFEFFIGRGKLRKAIPVFAVITFIYNVVFLVLLFTQANLSGDTFWSFFARYLVTSFASICYGVGYFVCLFNKLKKKRNDEKPDTKD